MKYNTAGKPIVEPIISCNCGLTGGCAKCRPFRESFIGSISDEEWEKEMKEKIRLGKWITIGRVTEMIERIDERVVPADSDIPDNEVWRIAKEYGIEKPPSEVKEEIRKDPLAVL